MPDVLTQITAVCDPAIPADHPLGRAARSAATDAVTTTGRIGRIAPMTIDVDSCGTPGVSGACYAPAVASGVVTGGRS
jgi:hypothetical protein